MPVIHFVPLEWMVRAAWNMPMICKSYTVTIERRIQDAWIRSAVTVEQLLRSV